MATVELNDLIVFDVEPDWSQGVAETRSYVTNILGSYSTAEQRIRLRKTPRTLLSYDMAAVELTEFQYLRNLIYGRQATIFAVPLWPDAIALEGNLLAGDTSIPCDTSYARFEALQGVLIWQAMRNFELRRIQTIGTDVLNLSSPLESPWNIDDQVWVIPVLIGRMSDSVPYSVAGAVAQTGKIEFTCEPFLLLEDGS